MTLPRSADLHQINGHHEVLMAITSGRTFDDPKRLRHETEELYITSPAEVYGALEAVTGVGTEWKEAVHNSWQIAQQRTVELNLKDKYPPNFQVPEGETLDSYLQRRAREGLDRRFAEIARAGGRIDGDAYRERLERELGGREDRVSGLLPHRPGLHQLGEEQRHPGRAGARFRRGSLVAY